MARPLLAALRGEDSEDGLIGAVFLAEALMILREAHTAKKGAAQAPRPMLRRRR